jgi:alpha-glucosidase (family GH31 glycosyl hydrolase)
MASCRPEERDAVDTLPSVPRRDRIRALAAAGLLAAATALLTAAPGHAEIVADAGALRADVSSDPWGLTLVDPSGASVLAEHPGTAPGSAGTVGFRAAGVWYHATRVASASVEEGEYVAELETSEPGGRTIELRLRAAGEGVVALEAAVRGPGLPIEALGMGFEASAGERYLGFGERSNAVDQRGNVVENYVTDGPYEADEQAIIELFIPPWGFRPREDATYYPVPWLLSSSGYGVLVDSPETSYFQLDQSGSWSVELVNAPPEELPPPTAPPPDELRLRFFAGPRPADALRRFTRETGRQPQPAAPWVFGPWVQPNGDAASQLGQLDDLQDADAPTSVAQTYLHYLPCGDQQGGRDSERERTDAIHARGLAVTTYLNPMVCSSYDSVYGPAAGGGGLIENALGEPYLFQYSTDTSFQVAELDFAEPAGRAAFSSVAGEAIEDGHDGWMEDFGEYTPLDSQSHSGTPGTALHNPYARQYHCAASDAIASAPRPMVRFQRSGWTGTAPCAQVVWGGDPTTDWGFDGLASSVKQALSVGLSGISTWGSDIGGFFALLDDQLSPELLARWVQFGAVSGVMRTQANGIAVPAKPRPQIWDSDQISNWRRYAKLHTQLYPYLVAADADYRRTGTPLMRHLALAFPGDAEAVAREDEYLFGPDLLAAPVLEAGATERALYLPRGRWVDLWRSLDYQEESGGLAMTRARTRRGGREVTLPAPLDELPLLARAGTVLPVLPPEVDTLTDYASGSTVALSERRRRLRLLAFPRGKSSAALYEDERLTSREKRKRWRLRIKGTARRRYELSASMKTLKRRFVPCRVKLNGKPLSKRRWSYDRSARVLHARFRGSQVRLVVKKRCR